MIAIFLIFALTFYIDFPLLLKLKDKKALIAFCVLFAVSLIFTVIIIFNIKVENLVLLMWKFMKKLGITYPE